MNRMAELYARACDAMPGGVSSPVRAFGSVGGTPVFVKSAAGARVVDQFGGEYVDLIGSWGPALLGHAHPDVVAAVQQAAARGLSFGAPTQAEVELAEEIGRRVPIAQQVRFVSTGTEATMTAIRLARGATGRAKIIKFAGCYHGHSDGLLAAAGSGLATQGLPASAGVTAGATGDTIVVDFGDVDGLTAAFDEHEIAAVITEGAPANMGVICPAPGWNATIAELCRDRGALMILDEVLTGFRVGPAGWWGLEGDFTPDLVTFGKVVGGGMPLAAIGGRADLMQLLAPVGAVYQAGTLSGNPLATAAGLATLQLCTDDVYQVVDARAAQLQEAVSQALSAAGVPHYVSAAGSLFSVFFRAEPVSNYAQAQTQDSAAYGRFFHAMLDAGVLLPPSAFEAWFLSAAHDDAALNEIIEALPAAAEAASANSEP